MLMLFLCYFRVVMVLILCCYCAFFVLLLFLTPKQIINLFSLQIQITLKLPTVHSFSNNCYNRIQIGTIVGGFLFRRAGVVYSGGGSACCPALLFCPRSSTSNHHNICSLTRRSERSSQFVQATHFSRLIMPDSLASSAHLLSH